MLWFLFVFFLIFIASFFFTDEEENSFERSYRKILNCFWSMTTGTPVYRQGF